MPASRRRRRGHIRKDEKNVHLQENEKDGKEKKTNEKE